LLSQPSAILQHAANPLQNLPSQLLWGAKERLLSLWTVLLIGVAAAAVRKSAENQTTMAEMCITLTIAASTATHYLKQQLLLLQGNRDQLRWQGGRL
jgi:hypothetical protein